MTFFDQPPNHWNITNYLNQHDPTSPTYNHRILLDKWTKSLIAITSNANYTTEQRDKAQLLLDQYNHRGRDSDRNRAKEWLTSRVPGKKRKLKSGASVTIFQAPVNQGTFNNATFHQSGSANEDGGQVSQAASVVDSSVELSEELNVYQAPVNQGTFNGSTFNQAGQKRKSPEDNSDTAQIPDGDASLDGDVSPLDDSTAAQSKKGNDDFASIYNEFVATYKAMSTGSKFIFSSTGRVLEDVIFEEASTLTKKSSAHLWVVDFKDTVVMSWFPPQERDELRNRILPLPETDKGLLSSMARFSLADTTEEYRRIAEEVPYRKEGESYDRSKHFDAAWVNTVILSMLSILESPNNLLLYPSLREGWFDCNPWSFLIDQCMLGLDGVLVQRKEIICLALKLVDSINTDPPGKGNHGKRFDAVIHTLGGSPVIEYGAIEVAKSFESIHTKKWVTDSTKLVRALQAMLSRLHKLVDHDETAIGKLQVVGLLNAGLNLQIIRMNGVNRNVFLLERGRIRSVPTTVASLKSIFSVMISVSVFKQIIRDCVGVVEGYSGLACGSARQTEQELYEELAKQNEL